MHTLKSKEYNNLQISIYVDQKDVDRAICNITVLSDEKNSNVGYESEMVCKFQGNKKAYIFPTKSKEIFFHDFPEYDLKCKSEILSFNKSNLILILLFLCLLL